MSDVKIPEEIATWMIERGWGEHHDEWHFVRRWDYWELLEQNPNVPDRWKDWIRAKFQEANEKGWTQAEVQEGEDGNGEDFLFMHRAMIELILKEFPQHVHYFRGWDSPPTDHESELDPVLVPTPEPNQECAPTRKLICQNMLDGIHRIKNEQGTFASEDEFGRFIETNSRPTEDEPAARSDDARSGVHNYLHGRWSGMSEDLDLGDPRFNIFNTRFWRLHGWIDYQWWRYRFAIGANNNDAQYQSKLGFYKQMMDMRHQRHHEFSAVTKSLQPVTSRNAFADVLAEIEE
tara:strand:- start:224 stop:1093 length:870 start_codon:yes stop_codon:yes gene_type:complete